MASYVSSTEGRVIVVTNVQPVTDPAAAGQPQQYVGTRRFIKCWPQALGTVQIMVGAVMLLVGVAMIPSRASIGVFSGFLVWGAGLHITAGSLTVAAGKRPTRCLVSCALGFCVAAAASGGIGFVMYMIDTVNPVGCYDYDFDYGYGYGRSRGCSLAEGVSGVLAVFNLLEMIVAIVVASYGCYSTSSCGDDPTVVVIPERALATNECDAHMDPRVQNVKGAEEEVASTSQPPAYSSL